LVTVNQTIVVIIINIIICCIIIVDNQPSISLLLVTINRTIVIIIINIIIRCIIIVDNQPSILLLLVTINQTIVIIIINIITHCIIGLQGTSIVRRSPRVNTNHRGGGCLVIGSFFCGGGGIRSPDEDAGGDTLESQQNSPLLGEGRRHL
jgi:hypothetical protein